MALARDGFDIAINYVNGSQSALSLKNEAIGAAAIVCRADISKKSEVDDMCNQAGASSARGVRIPPGGGGPLWLVLT